MYVNFNFQPSEKEKIINRFGEVFLEKSKENINLCIDKYRLSNIELINSYSANLVFKCHSTQFGDIVIKMNSNPRFLLDEYRTLKQYDGIKYCRAYECDKESGILIIENIKPGTTLKVETSLKKRLEAFNNIYNNLHFIEAGDKDYPTYRHWVYRITDYMKRQENYKELYGYMKRAKEIFDLLSKNYSRKMLLHGDLHHENILSCGENSYKLIDPKGVVGDPIFDLPRFIFNELEDDLTFLLSDKINFIVSNMEENLRVPTHIIKLCFFIETIMALCWFVEDGVTDETYKRFLSIAGFVNGIIE